MKLEEETCHWQSILEQLDIADLNSIGFVKHKHQSSNDNTQMDGSIGRESKGEAKIIFIERKNTAVQGGRTKGSCLLSRVGQLIGQLDNK